MDRITCIEVFVAAILGLTCLSHILHPRLWAELFTDFFQRPYAGLIIGAFTLPLGLLIALGHNVWAWDPSVIVTVIGWAWTFKGGLYLLRPSTPRQVGARHMQHPGRFRIAGGIGLLLAAVIALEALVLKPNRMAVAPVGLNATAPLAQD